MTLNTAMVTKNVIIRQRAYDFLLYSIVAMALSRVVSDIFNVEKYRDLEITVKSQPIKVIESGTIR